MPAFVGVCANSGFMPYAELVKGGEVSVLAPMIGLYSVVPVLFGMLVMREALGVRKAAGIVLSLTAVLLLALSGAGSFSSSSGAASSPAQVAGKVGLFVATVALWGGGDTFAAYLGRGLTTFEVAASNSVGQLATAAIYGLVAVAEGDQLGAASGGGGGGSGAGGLGFVGLSVVANVLGILAWMCFTELGRYAGASDFTPVVALYVFVPVVFAAVLLGEPIADSPAKVAGLVCAGLASVLMSAG